MAVTILLACLRARRREEEKILAANPCTDAERVLDCALCACACLQTHRGAISIKQLSEMSSIKTDDIVSTLQALQLIKYWKGQHMIAVSPKVLHDHLESESARKQLQVDVSKLHWQPHSLRAA